MGNMRLWENFEHDNGKYGRQSGDVLAGGGWLWLAMAGCMCVHRQQDHHRGTRFEWAEIREIRRSNGRRWEKRIETPPREKKTEWEKKYPNTKTTTNTTNKQTAIKRKVWNEINIYAFGKFLLRLAYSCSCHGNTVGRVPLSLTRRFVRLFCLFCPCFLFSPLPTTNDMGNRWAHRRKKIYMPICRYVPPWRCHSLLLFFLGNLFITCCCFSRTRFAPLPLKWCLYPVCFWISVLFPLSVIHFHLMFRPTPNAIKEQNIIKVLIKFYFFVFKMCQRR